MLTPTRALTIGYLQVGFAEHGICRYGRLLAAEGRKRANVTVLERNIGLSGERLADRLRLEEIGTELSQADVVHLQVSVSGDGSWGPNGRALENLGTFRGHCRAPIVVTLHDVNNLRALGCATPLRWLSRVGMELVKVPLRPAVRLARQLRRGSLQCRSMFTSLMDLERVYPYLITRWVARWANAVLILSGGERGTLESTCLARNVTVLPHFIEDAPVVADSARCSTPSRRTVVLVGFIFSSKGHQLMVEAMELLPDIDVVFVGGPRPGGAGSDTVERLMALARQRGVADRLYTTGYLPDGEFQRHLATADLAVCPFERDKSASGSLSSLIAAGCPVLASDSPLIAEYNAIVPGAIPTFRPYTPAALAAAVRELLGKSRLELTRPYQELRWRLSISSIYDRHLETYHRVVQPQGAEPSSIRKHRQVLGG
jgi:glycosyltransferase involved in cell wall biosynthesis